MYNAQQMFGEPEPTPKNTNILPLLWFYHVKPNGIRKAQCVINGSKRMKGTVILGKTYAAALEQPGARLSWALSALHNNIIIGADVSNAYAEADTPIAPFFVKVDDHYYQRWTEVMGRPPIPPNMVMRVNHAL